MKIILYQRPFCKAIERVYDMLSRLKKLRRENGTSVVSFAFIAIAIVSRFIIYFSPDIAKSLGLDEKRFENVVGIVLTPTLLFIGYLIFEKSVDKYREEIKEEQKILKEKQNELGDNFKS